MSNTQTKTLRVLTKKPGLVNRPKVEEVEHSLSAMQALVAPMKHPDGYHMIELVRIDELMEQGIDLYINEEGKFNGCRPNFQIWNGQDIVMGPVFFVSSNDEGESVSLTDKQVEFAEKWLASMPQSIF